MKLEMMFKNVLDYSYEDLLVSIEERNKIRSQRIQAMSKNDVPEKKVSANKLSDGDKAILKALGLSMKDFMDFKGLSTKEDTEHEMYPFVLCEGCGHILVDHEGNRIKFMSDGDIKKNRLTLISVLSQRRRNGTV